MSAVEAILDRQRRAELERMRRDQEIAEAVHRQWALKFSNTLAAAIRLHEQAEAVGFNLVRIPLKRWCLAAYTLLAFGSTEARHAFLLADEDGKNRLVAALDRDRFIADEFGRAKEVLP